MRNASKGSESGRDGNKTTKISMKLLVDSKIPSSFYPRCPQFSSIFTTFHFSFLFFFTVYVNRCYCHRVRPFSWMLSRYRNDICNLTKTRRIFVS